MSANEPVELFRGTPLEERESRMRDGAGALAHGRGGFIRRPDFLLWLSATLMLLGLAAILLGWAGASRSILMEEQLPYLISGGLLGLALSFIGAITLLAQWVLVLVREQRAREVVRRRDHEQLIEHLDAMTAALSSARRRSSR